MNESRPGEPVNECRACEPLLAAYVDGEVAPDDGERVRSHVASCACCRDRLAGERAAREAIRARRTGLRACASDELKARCASFAALRPDAVPAPGPVTSRPAIPASFLRRWAPLSIAATLLLAVSVVFGLGLNDKVQALAVQATIDHVKCSRFNTGSAPADPIAAARDWQARFGWPIAVPASSSASRLELRAVRRCAVTDGRVAHLMYIWMGEPLSVYVLPKRTLADGAELVRRFRHNSVMWSQNDRTYIMVTPHDRGPALDGVVAYVRANAF
ncbi:MAG TPA: zf-HC2 domain-containing protein [Vicinamibacterales bacterium]|nr:zf-HC2 domain-containing protein [Vicinamibacterales bacterium]